MTEKLMAVHETDVRTSNKSHLKFTMPFMFGYAS